MKKTYFLLILWLVVISSCRRNFDEPNPNAPTIASFWRTQDDAVKGINAVYSTFHRGPALYSRWMFYHGILRSDEGFGSGGDGGLNNLMSFVQTDYNGSHLGDFLRRYIQGKPGACQCAKHSNEPGPSTPHNCRGKVSARAVLFQTDALLWTTCFDAYAITTIRRTRKCYY